MFSFNDRESKTISDEMAIRAAERTLGGVGLGDHQAVYACHRDTDNVHVHVAMGTVDPYTGKAMERSRIYYRLSEQARYTELAMGLEHDHGAFVVDQTTGSVRLALGAEKAMWAREAIEDRLQDAARKAVNQYEDFEDSDSWAAAIGERIGAQIRERQGRGEPMLAADVHNVAAGLAARVRAAGNGQLEVEVYDVLSEDERKKKLKEIIAADPVLAKRQSYGERVHVRVPTHTLRATVTIDVEDIAGHSRLGDKVTDFAAAEEEARLERIRFLAELEDVAAAEQSYADAVRADPTMVTREIVARGKANVSHR